MVKVDEVDLVGSTARVVREGLLRRARRAVERDRQGALARLQEARQAAPPRREPGNAAPEERFKEVYAAYDVLGDAEKRKEYDEVRRMVASGVGPGGFGGFGPGGFGAGGQAFQFDVDFGGPCGGIFGDLLGGLLGDRGGAVAAPRPDRSAARISRPSCTCRSTTRCAASRSTVRFRADATCSTCHGLGRGAGHVPRDVPASATAAGRSRSTRARSRSRRCAPRVAGAARSSRRRARRVTGRGVEMRAREVKVRVPAGVTDGQRIRVKGRGARGRERRSARRPLRGRARAVAPAVRPQRQRPHDAAAGHVRGSRRSAPT